MVLRQFDPSKNAVINPWDIVSELERCLKTVVLCFPENLIRYAADNLDREVWDRRSLSNGDGLDAKYAIVHLAVALAARWEARFS